MPSYADYYGGGGGQSSNPYYDGEIFDQQRRYELPGNFDLRNQRDQAMGKMLTQKYRLKYRLPRRVSNNQESAFMPYGQGGYGAAPEQSQGMRLVYPAPPDYYSGMYDKYGRAGGMDPMPYPIVRPHGASPLF